MKKNKKPRAEIVIFILAIFIMIAYYTVSITIANSDMSPWLKYLFLK